MKWLSSRLLSQHLKGQTRSNSWSDDFSFDDYRTSDVNRSLLGESNRFFYDNLRKSYADLLYCYGLLTQRAQVLKYLSIPPTPLQTGVEFVTECQNCRKTTRGPSCLHCKKYLLYCSLCQLPVRGAANACLACGHAGHTVRTITKKIWSQIIGLWFANRRISSSGSPSTTCVLHAAVSAWRNAEAFLTTELFWAFLQLS